MTSGAPLGILAGGGPFPGRVAAAARAAGRPVFIVALRGYAELFRIGASSLLNDVLMQIHKERSGRYDGPDYVTID